MSVAVVIPTLDEATCVDRALRSIDLSSEKDERMVLQRIVADASTSSDTKRVAEEAGATVIHCKRRGRGVQMNEGAKACKEDFVLFLHADCSLPKGYDLHLQKAFDSGAAWGSFQGIRIMKEGWSFRMVETGVRWRTRIFGCPYGDQGIFVKKEIFDRMGGYHEPTFLEDVEFCTRLNRTWGRPWLIPQSMMTSSRRWDAIGTARSVITNQLILCAYAGGVSSEALEAWYRVPEGHGTKDGRSLSGLASLAISSWTSRFVSMARHWNSRNQIRERDPRKAMVLNGAPNASLHI